MNSGIYMLTCKINGYRYIGQSCNIIRRMWEHKCQRKSEPSLPISKAIKEFGWANFEQKVLEYCPLEDLDEKEIYYIATLNPEYNVAKGGKLGMTGYHHSEETKELCKLAAIKEWQDKTPEEKAYVLAFQLTHRSKKGDKLSDSTREKLRQANLAKSKAKKPKLNALRR